MMEPKSRLLYVYEWLRANGGNPYAPSEKLAMLANIKAGIDEIDRQTAIIHANENNIVLTCDSALAAAMQPAYLEDRGWSAQKSLMQN